MVSRRTLVVAPVCGLITRIARADAPATALSDAAPRALGGRLLREVSLLPGMGDYRATPYIAVAETLQHWGPALAIRVLRRTADQGLGEPVILLCRLLFRGRAARSGALVLLGGSAPGDWPLEPLHLQDGVPFLITTGYDLDGRAEGARKYLDYCIDNAAWSQIRLRTASQRQVERAFRALLASRRWSRPLQAEEIRFLARQVGRAAADQGLSAYSRNWPDRGETWPEWTDPDETRVVGQEPPAFPLSLRERLLWRKWKRPALEPQ